MSGPIDLNRWVGVGRLTKDPVQTKKGGARFDIASNGWKDKVSYPKIMVSSNGAEACLKYLKKGAQVAIEGRWEQYEYEEQETGKKRREWIVYAQNVQFLDRKEKPVEKTSGNEIPF